MGDQWYVAWGKKKLGPFSLEELKERARTGRVLPIDMVFQEGTPKWRPASEVEGLCWRTAEKVVQAVPLSPHSQTPISPPTAPTNPGDMVEGIPLPPTPTSPTPLALARDYAEALENLDGGTDVPSPLTNHAPLVPASVNPEDISEPEPLPPLPTNP